MWFLPSRQRPDNLARFFNAFKTTGASTPGVVWLDDDDAHNYNGIELPESWVKIVWARLDGIGPVTNEFFKLFPDEPWYGLLGDDLMPKTEGWDIKLVEAAGSDGLAYGDDTINGESHASHPVIGGDLVRSLGWLALPGCKRLYIDNALFEAAKCRGKTYYLPHVITEHWHFSNGKAPVDDTYLKPGAESDREIFMKWREELYDKWRLA